MSGAQYEFERYFYGPFSANLSEDLDMLESLGLVSINESIVTVEKQPRVRYSYTITSKGKALLDAKRKQVRTSTIAKIASLRKCHIIRKDLTKYGADFLNG